MNCLVAKKSVKRVCYKLKSHGKSLLEVSGEGENEEEETSICVKSRKRSKRREWEGRWRRGKGLMFIGEI